MVALRDERASRTYYQSFRVAVPVGRAVLHRDTLQPIAVAGPPIKEARSRVYGAGCSIVTA